ncbi:hypothetical protein ABPG75_008657 [Micractinium tetrahymenae]
MQELIDLTGTDEEGSRVAVGRRRAAPGSRPAAAAAAAAAAAGSSSPAVAGQKGGRKRSAAAAGGSVDGSSSRRRQKKEPGAEAAPSPHKQSGKRHGEKRTDAFGKTVSWRPKPSKQVQERIERALPCSGHRLFLIDRRQLRAPESSPEGAAEEFHVLGATGNVYTVTVGRHPGCTCPDAQKGHVCKHYLFVQLRVLRLPRDDPLVWQAALLPSEADEVLSGQHSCRSGGGGGDAVLAPDAVRQQFQRLAGGEPGAEAAQEGGGQPSGQRPFEADEDCPICFDALAPTAGGTAGAAGEAVSWCTACGKSAHASCMQKWVRSKASAGHDVTCPLCRAPWQDGAGKVSAAGGASGGGAAAAAAAGGSPGQYLNLGQHSEAHRGGASLEQLYGSESAYWIGRRSYRRW